MKDLVGILNQPIIVITSDGHCIGGILHSFDANFNILLKKSHERIYSQTQGVSVVQLGSQMIRGDNVALIGKINPVLETSVDFDAIRADPPKPIL
jgi:U6 snRNA-associated Sm-like protein LSm8